MFKKMYLITACIISVCLYSCGKKTTPSNTQASAEAATTLKIDSAVVKKVALKPKVKPAPTPKVIVVNDAGAKRAVDGRMYYDMQGKRYWRSNRDGKYYLYNKSMHTDPAFKPPVKKA